VYGTRTRGLRRDRHAQSVFTVSNGSQPAATTEVRPTRLGTIWAQSGTGLVVPHERLLTVREAAARLGVSTSTVYSLCARGKLAHIRACNAIRIAPGDLQVVGKASRNGSC
jgi:excisionase family DNA binding protein